MDSLPPLDWARGTTITSSSDGSTVRVSIPSLGRVWRMDMVGLAKIMHWISQPSGPTPAAIRQLVVANALVPAGLSDKHDSAIWGPSRRFHYWANHEIYQDGPDPSGAARDAVIATFNPADVTYLRGVASNEGNVEQLLSADVANIVWQASSRMRANRRRVAEADSASTLLFSYGTTFDLIVIDHIARAPVAWADLGRIRSGRPILADPEAIIREAGMGQGSRGIIVVGRYEDYQRRYRHEKAMRGFLVDGGRVLGEVARATSTAYGSAVVSDTPLSPRIASSLGLDVHRFLVAGLVAIPMR